MASEFRISAEWKRRERGVRSQTEKLTAECGANVPPLPLREMLETQRVVDVRFVPMLSTAGLSIEGTSFVIYVNCPDPAAGQRWRAALFDPLDGGRGLPVRVRFSIAHEIVHTLLFDLGSTGLKDTLGNHPRTVESLERVCNRCANDLLMPEWMLEESTRDRDLLNIDVLRELAAAFAVSFESMIHRMRRCRLWHQYEGVAAYIIDVEGELRIRALWRHGTVKPIFPNADYDAAARTLIGDIELPNAKPRERIGHASKAQAVVKVPVKVGREHAKQAFAVNWLHISMHPRSYLVVLRPDGPPLA